MPVFRVNNRLKPRSRIETSTPAKTSINKSTAYHTPNSTSATPATRHVAMSTRYVKVKDFFSSALSCKSRVT